MNLYPYIEISRSIVQVMQPLVEISIHNLETQRIEFIEGTISSRKVGDPSEFASEIMIKEAMKAKVFPKVNSNGRLIKTIVNSIKEDGVAKLLICIDYDVTIFQDLQYLVSISLDFNNLSKNKTSGNSRERVYKTLYSILEQQGASPKFLSQKKKKEIIKISYDAGIFTEKNSVSYVADILNVSRATIFNYLKEWRN